MARANNRIIDKPKHTTSDKEIVRRLVLPIDIDAIRPAGISATDAEKAEALKVADDVDRYLQAQGWPPPMFVDSGNGYHLFYRVDLPNDAARPAMVKANLARLADKFDTDAAKVDQSIHNAARIMRIPGTWARKGDPTGDRLHRPSILMEEPRWAQ